MSSQGTETLGRIEGKLDLISYQVTQFELRDADKEKRLRTVEKWMYALPPTVLLGIANVVATVYMFSQ